jgi:hypothetical protein
MLDVTPIELSFGLGAWIGIICIGFIVFGYEKEVPAIVAVIIPLITIALLYIIIQIGQGLLALLLWTVTLMLRQDIFAAAFILLLISLMTITLRNAYLLIQN